MKNKKIVTSLIHAADGVLSALRTERNLRFHFVIANLICIFAAFYKLTKPEWAILISSIFTVITAELINTAVENAVDTATEEIRTTAKIAKDAAAGAVLLSATGAVITGFFLFGDIFRITDTLKTIFTELKILIPCLAVGIADIIFLFRFKEKGNDKI